MVCRIFIYTPQIESAGCKILSTWLSQFQSSVSTMIIPIMLVQISQSLTRNTIHYLKELDVGGNLTYKIQVYTSKLFAMNHQFEHSTYASNHTLEYLDGDCIVRFATCYCKWILWTQLKAMLQWRKFWNIYYLNIDMRPMFVWDLEGKRNLASTCGLVWKSWKAVVNDIGVHYGIHARSYLSFNLLGPCHYCLFLFHITK